MPGDQGDKSLATGRPSPTLWAPRGGIPPGYLPVAVPVAPPGRPPDHIELDMSRSRNLLPVSRIALRHPLTRVDLHPFGR